VINENAELEKRVRQGLAGEVANKRYGLPFIGDNSFLPNRLEPLERLPSAHWYERVTADQAKIRPRTTRLTIWVDRADLSRTRSELYAPGEAVDEVPALAWTDIVPS
jgi:CRISPR-associated protein Cas5t